MTANSSNPALLPLQMENIPVELRDRPQWVAWKLVNRLKESKSTKIPINPKTGSLASSADPNTWGTFAKAMAYYQSGQANGTGFVFSAQDPVLSNTR